MGGSTIFAFPGALKIPPGTTGASHQRVNINSAGLLSTFCSGGDMPHTAEVPNLYPSAVTIAVEDADAGVPVRICYGGAGQGTASIASKIGTQVPSESAGGMRIPFDASTTPGGGQSIQSITVDSAGAHCQLFFEWD